jgi:hAT family C-terminal dimerisation region
MAYDLLVIPVISSEVERVFSGAKNTINNYRTRLGAAIFEMTELKKQWIRADLGDDMGSSSDLAGYLTPDGKAVLEKMLWGKKGRPKDLDEDVEPV